jgi:proline iminopeptidase
MDPEHMQAMARALPRGQYLYCPKGSHVAMYDDSVMYMHGLVNSLHGVDRGAA